LNLLVSFIGFFFLSVFCMSAEPTKPGVCPRKDLELAVSGVCAELCSHDGDCPNDEKCCSNGCGHQCMPPYKEKPGVCPKNPEVALLGECVESCSYDSDCPKDEKCCSKGCGQQCMPPYKGIGYISVGQLQGWTGMYVCVENSRVEFQVSLTRKFRRKAFI
uniref:WAP domain-containing protein n=1 Tax=Sinocyclocheilus rhinocerous TaxID=307959 RepID=A0A673L127_9TELE